MSLHVPIALAAKAVTFGRQTTQFKQLIAFLAIISLVLWAGVLITLFARLVVCHLWYRRRYPVPATLPVNNQTPPGS